MEHLIEAYGYVAVFVVVTLGSAGLPLPSVAILAAAATYAGITHQFNIWVLISVAAAAAILGNLLGYGLGVTVGSHLLVRYGPRLGLTEHRRQFGQDVFARYGAWAVLVGRFVGPLRAWVGLLAGLSRIPWGAFVRMSVVSGVAWALLWGLGPYLVGSIDHDVSLPGGALVWGLLAAAALIVLWRIVRRLRVKPDTETVDTVTRSGARNP